MVASVQLQLVSAKTQWEQGSPGLSPCRPTTRPGRLRAVGVRGFGWITSHMFRRCTHLISASPLLGTSVGLLTGRTHKRPRRDLAQLMQSGQPVRSPSARTPQVSQMRSAPFRTRAVSPQSGQTSASLRSPPWVPRSCGVGRKTRLSGAAPRENPREMNREAGWGSGASRGWPSAAPRPRPSAPRFHHFG